MVMFAPTSGNVADLVGALKQLALEGKVTPDSDGKKWSLRNWVAATPCQRAVCHNGRWDSPATNAAA